MKCISLVTLTLSLTLIVVGISAQVEFQYIDAGIPGYTTNSYSDNSSISWGDYNNDGNFDILISGRFSNGVVRIFRNDGNDIFTEASSFQSCNGHDAQWGDYDNDGYLDVIATTNSGFRVFRNDGDGIFTQSLQVSDFPGATHVEWTDINNDGVLDVLIAGNTGVRSYKYLANSYFHYQQISDIKEISSFELADIDNDGDIDLIVSGFMDVVYEGIDVSFIVSRPFTHVYLNENSQYILHFSIPSFKAYYIDSGDYNADGYLGFYIGGGRYEIFDDGLGSPPFFHELDYCTYHYSYLSGLSSPIMDIFGNPIWGSVSSGDVNNDGILDFIGSGWYYMNGGYVDASRIFITDNGLLTENQEYYDGVSSATIRFCDYNNDGKLDFIVTGRGVQVNQASTFLYKNISEISTNSTPNAPGNLMTENAGEYIKLMWDTASDVETPTAGLSYSLKIGTTPGGQDVMSAMANMDGSRLISKRGIINGNCFWKIHKSVFQQGLDYYWSVQAIDNSYRGSPFSPPLLIPAIEPEITLLGNSSVNFGNTYMNSSSEWYPIEFRNTGLGLTITNVYLKNSLMSFQFDDSSISDISDFGSTGTLYVRFSPQYLGSQIDTLCIVSNAINQPILEIRLTGSGVFTPPGTPTGLQLFIVDNDIQLCWDPVTSDILGNTMIPDGYVVLYNELPNETNYWYLGFSEDTGYTHHHVLNYRDSTYYKVLAVKFYGRNRLDILNDISNKSYRFAWDEVKDILDNETLRE